MKTKVAAIILTPVIALAAALMHAAIGADPMPVSARAADKTSQFVSYETGFARWLHAPRTLEMSQGVMFQQEDAVLKTEAAIASLDAEENLVSAKSLAPVHLYDTQNDLTGKQGTVDFKHRLATLTANVVLIVKPGEKEANAATGSLRSRFKDAATLTCETMTYDYRHKTGHVPGKLTIRQKDRVLSADSGDYNGAAQTVTLNGDVHGHDSEGNDIQTTQAIMGIKEGDESITIPVPTHGLLRVKDEADAPAATP